MDILKRNLAPIVPAAWEEIDGEAQRVLRLKLAGRRVVDIDGPHGWEHAAVNTGHLGLVAGEPLPGLKVGLRLVKPLLEVRTKFFLQSMELDCAGRGAPDIDLQAVVAAAEKVACFEDGVLFNGYKPAGIEGIIPASKHKLVAIDSPEHYPHAVIEARECLYGAGIDGPYMLVLSPECYQELSQATEDGYPIRKRIEGKLIDGPLVRSESVEGAVLISRRGGDFLMTVGQDLSIGYAAHDRDKVELYLTESFTFQIFEPAAAIQLKRAKGRKK
jgi:uncharacterized linocin/CFP29 family protein